jgi:hypothetical protein
MKGTRTRLTNTSLAQHCRRVLQVKSKGERPERVGHAASGLAGEGNAELKLPIGTLLAKAKRDFARSRDPAPPSLSTRDNHRHSSQNATGNVMARELDP